MSEPAEFLTYLLFCLILLHPYIVGMNASVSVMPLDNSVVQSNPMILDSLPDPPFEEVSTGQDCN